MSEAPRNPETGVWGVLESMTAECPFCPGERHEAIQWWETTVVGCPLCPPDEWWWLPAAGEPKWVRVVNAERLG